jgi:hypothetical protein
MLSEPYFLLSFSKSDILLLPTMFKIIFTVHFRHFFCRDSCPFCYLLRVPLPISLYLSSFILFMLHSLPSLYYFPFNIFPLVASTDISSSLDECVFHNRYPYTSVVSSEEKRTKMCEWGGGGAASLRHNGNVTSKQCCGTGAGTGTAGTVSF